MDRFMTGELAANFEIKIGTSISEKARTSETVNACSDKQSSDPILTASESTGREQP